MPDPNKHPTRKDLSSEPARPSTTSYLLKTKKHDDSGFRLDVSNISSGIFSA